MAANAERISRDTCADDEIHLLTLSAYRVLLVLENCHKPRAISCVRVAAKAGVSWKGALRSVKSLQALGLIECQSSKGKRTVFKSNVWIGELIKDLGESTGRLFLIIMLLTDRYGSGGRLFISNESLSRNAKLRESTFIAARQKLVDADLLQYTRTDAQHIGTYVPIPGPHVVIRHRSRGLISAEGRS